MSGTFCTAKGSRAKEGGNASKTGAIASEHKPLLENILNPKTHFQSLVNIQEAQGSQVRTTADV